MRHISKVSETKFSFKIFLAKLAQSTLKSSIICDKRDRLKERFERIAQVNYSPRASQMAESEKSTCYAAFVSCVAQIDPVH